MRDRLRSVAEQLERAADRPEDDDDGACMGLVEVPAVGASTIRVLSVVLSRGFG
jgi:hypothetical protein